MIDSNTYMGGKIKSLGFEKDGQRYTAGVLLPGEYSFDTEKEEHITVTVGPIDILLPNKEWKTYSDGDVVIVPANVKFKLKASSAGSYICIYK